MNSVTPMDQSAISERARARGLHTLDDLKREMLRQRGSWWQGRQFHCPLCDLDFVDAKTAAEHVVLRQHPVLRLDLNPPRPAYRHRHRR